MNNNAAKLLIRFKPLPTQRRFLLDRAPFLAYIGGYGSGKTYALCHKAILLSGANPGLPGMIVAPTYAMLRDVVIHTFIEILEQNNIQYQLNKSTHLIKTDWGGLIRFRSADNPSTLRGPNLPWVGIDEMALIEREAWHAIISRVRHPRAQRRQVFGVTTPEGLNWVYETFVDDPKPGYKVLYADTRENIYLPQDYARSLLDSLDPDNVKQYICGRFVASTSNQVYKNFDLHTHITPHNPLINYPTGPQTHHQEHAPTLSPDLPLCIACDFNVAPCVWLAIQHHRGTVYVADEIVLRNTTTQEMIEEILRRGYHQHPAGHIIYGDPAGHARSTVASTSDYQLLHNAGFSNQRILRCHTPVRDRINALNARLRDAAGKSHLFIHPQCRTLRRDLLQVRYQPGTAAIDKTSNTNLTHPTDALGYFLVVEYPIVRPVRGPESVWNVLKR